MAATNNQYVISNVEALWPRINKTYKFDSAENRTVPCEATDDGAKCREVVEKNLVQCDRNKTGAMGTFVGAAAFALTTAYLF